MSKLTTDNAAKTDLALREVSKVRDAVGIISVHERNVRTLAKLVELVEAGEVAGDLEKIKRAHGAYVALLASATAVADELFEALPSLWDVMAVSYAEGIEAGKKAV